MEVCLKRDGIVHVLFQCGTVSIPTKFQQSLLFCSLKNTGYYEEI